MSRRTIINLIFFVFVFGVMCLWAVQNIVRIAVRHEVRLYTFSTGHNWGYGTALPVEDDCVLRDDRFGQPEPSNIRLGSAASTVATVSLNPSRLKKNGSARRPANTCTLPSSFLKRTS